MTTKFKLRSGFADRVDAVVRGMELVTDPHPPIVQPKVGPFRILHFCVPVIRAGNGFATSEGKCLMNFVKLLIGAILVAMAMALASEARAAPSTVDEAVPTTRQTDFQFGLDVGYDSNVARSDRILAARRGLTLGDEITTPSFDITIARPLGRTMVFIKGVGNYDFHAINTRRDHENLDFSGGAGAHLATCQESLVGNYGRIQSDLTDLAAGVTNNTRENEDVKFTSACGKTIGLAPGFAVTQSWANNSAAQLRQIDSRSLTVDASLAYRRPILGSISIFGQYVDALYPHRTLVVLGQTLAGGYEVYTAGLRYERHVGTRIDTTLSISYTALDPSAGSGSSFRGLTYSADLSYNLTSRIKAHASATRATVPSNRVFANYKIDDTYDADLSYMWGTRLTFKLLGSIASSEYRGGGAVARTVDLTQETLYSATASATYNLNKRWSLVLSGGDDERRANFPGLSYSSTKATLGATVKF